MRLNAKDLIRILGAVDGDSDVVFHLEDDDNNRYSADSVTIKEGQCFDADYTETDIVLHINLTPSGAYNLRECCEEVDEYKNEKEKAKIIDFLRYYGNDRKAVANALVISERTLYRRIKEYKIE